MRGKTHLVTGISAGMAMADWTQPRNLAVCAAIGGLAGLLPDWLQINLPGVKQIKGAFGHRGFSHWLLTAACSTLVLNSLSIAPGSLVAAFLAGWVSHILLDAMSGGVPAFWPFGRLKLAEIKTGSSLDTLLGACVLIGLGLILVIYYGSCLWWGACPVPK